MILLTVAVLAAGAVHERYDAVEATRAPQLLAEAIRFPTFEDNPTMHAAQKQWLLRTAASLGLEGRDAGLVTEIDLPGPPGAPVLGLIVHGDVQPVEEKSWKVPPWTGIVRDGAVWGRGAADDKGPMVQALLAMSALKTAGPARTHTVRLLVGSDEESKNLDLKSYLEKHPAPDLSLVLDSAFPVVVGEKAWDGLTVSADFGERAPSKPWSVGLVEAGISPSIVPDWARLILRWREGEPQWDDLAKRLAARTPSTGTRLQILRQAAELEVVVRGRAAHGGMNLEGGRNALVSLARIVEGELPPGGVDDLLAFARLAGSREPAPAAAAHRGASARPARGGGARVRQGAWGAGSRRRILRRRAARFRSTGEDRAPADGGLCARHRAQRSAGDLRRRHLREAGSERHRVRDVVSRKAVPWPRYRRAHPGCGSETRGARPDRGARRHRLRCAHAEALRPLVGLEETGHLALEDEMTFLQMHHVPGVGDHDISLVRIR
ncbi:MAG: M20/M25/M40 family metallo-hydrolase [Deltaproteobacteria bacterium]|nr:MAG: M20/M25/M40 family metallo-hydrolase [Deltaproteobacteria bacterium]